MIFFEPFELLGIANGSRRFSLAQLLLGKRVDGNEAAYK